MKKSPEISLLALDFAARLVAQTNAAGAIVLLLGHGDDDDQERLIGIGSAIANGEDAFRSVQANIVHLIDEMNAAPPTVKQTRALQAELDAIIKRKP
jgi:hypothetical protein